MLAPGLVHLGAQRHPSGSECAKIHLDAVSWHDVGGTTANAGGNEFPHMNSAIAKRRRINKPSERSTRIAEHVPAAPFDR